ncbi:MAG: ATP-binding protein [bacterium]|nr:ATP-binding protein [bacterium]
MITPSRFISGTFLKQKVDTDNFRNCQSNKDKKVSAKTGVFRNYLGKKVLGSCECINEMDWVILGEIDASEAFEPLKKIQLVFIFLLFIVPLVGFILGKIISEVISKPIIKLQKGMEIIGKGNLDHKVGTTAQDEIGQLSRSFDRMTEKLKDSQERLIRSEKLAVAGKLSSSIAHDIRNPLSTIKVVVYKLKMFTICKQNPEIMEKLSEISYEIDVSNKVINNFLEFTRIKKPVLLRENINPIIKEALSGFQLSRNIELALELQDDLPDTLLDKVQIREVFYNLIKNALEAMEKGGSLKISTVLKGGFIEIFFNDTGCGIPEENTGKIFEPLFSTKANGNGLGLFISASFIEGHRGKIKVESEAGKGTTFIIKLPFSPK